MKTFNVYDAKTHFSKLLRLVEQGEEVVVAKNGKPSFDITLRKPKSKLKLGIWKDRPIGYKDKDIVGSDPEIVKMFEDSINRPFPE